MTKTIAVVAANGRSGRAFIDAALEAGYILRAGYYGANTLPSHPNLLALKCDATNQDDIRRLLDGADVVVSLIGHGKNSPAWVQTDAIRTIAKIMNEKKIIRIISLTGTGVRFPGDTPSLIDRFMNLSIKLIDPKRVHDGIAHARFLQASNLNWTILRVLKLGNGAVGNKTVQLSLSGPAELLTPRDGVARVILQVINDTAYDCTAPIITHS